MPSVRYDLGYLKAGLEILEKYLLAKDLYWPIGVSPPPGEPPYPRLTLSGILLALARLKARELPGKIASEVADLERQLEIIRSHWRVAWEQKVGREFHARLNLWRDFLEEYRKNPANHRDRYIYEVGRRVMLQLLKNEAINLERPAEEELLSALDSLLDAYFSPGKFVWDADLAPGFPRQEFWYLYGNLR